MNRVPTGYDGDRAQLLRDAVRTSEFTKKEVLDIIRAFVRDFKNFDPDELEHRNDSTDSEKIESLCSNESDSASEGSVSSLDEMALHYADLEDMESELAENTSLDSAMQVDAAGSAIYNENSVISGAASQTKQPIDETHPLSEEKASAFPSRIPSPASGELSRTVDYPLTFIVYTREDGSIWRLETQNGRAPYQYHLSVNPNQTLKPANLRFFIKVLEREQVHATALSKFLTGMGILQYRYRTPRWFPTLLRHGAHEAVHELVHV